MTNGQCGIRFICSVCGGDGCDHCADSGTLACPCASGSYVHSVAESGETCTECGERFGNGSDILRPAPVSVIGDAPIILRHPFHIGCR